jgi:hypothetical protein
MRWNPSPLNETLMEKADENLTLRDMGLPIRDLFSALDGL